MELQEHIEGDAISARQLFNSFNYCSNMQPSMVIHTKFDSKICTKVYSLYRSNILQYRTIISDDFSWGELHNMRCFFFEDDFRMFGVWNFYSAMTLVIANI